MRKLSIALLLMLSFSVLLPAIMLVAAQPIELKILSPHWEGILTEYKTAFEQHMMDSQSIDVDVTWVDLGGTSDIVKFIDSEFAKTPDGIGFDLFWGGGVDPFIIQAEKGQLEGYQVPAEILDEVAGGEASFAGVPMYDNVYDPPRWYGTALSGFGIIYNKVVLAAEGLPEPKTWEDLTNPVVKSWVGSADPRHSGSTHMAYEIILQAYGWDEGLELATLLGANVRSWPQSSSAIPRSVGAGDIAYGLAIDFYAWSEVNKIGADKIGYVMPEGLTVINPDSIGILKGAPNLEIAQDFVDFVLSEAGQKLWMLPPGAEGGPIDETLGRMCVIPDLYTELAAETIVPTNPFEITNTLDYNATLGSARWGLINDLIGALIIDSHADLVSAWSAITEANQTLQNAGISSTKIPEAVTKLGSAPLTEAEALEHDWDNQTVRNMAISDWHTAALTKYSEASSLATAAGVELVENLKAQAQTNLLTGLGGGAVVGLVVGVALAYLMGRRGEIAAIGA
jgi:ABC-type Fe3+ transport system substrate-binding protein